MSLSILGEYDKILWRFLQNILEILVYTRQVWVVKKPSHAFVPLKSDMKWVKVISGKGLHNVYLVGL